MVDSQGTPSTKRTEPSTPFSPPSTKSTGKRRLGGRRAQLPLSSIPSNIQDDDLPMLDSQLTDGVAENGPSAKKAASDRSKRKGRKGQTAAAAGAGGGDGGEPSDSDEDMADAGQDNQGGGPGSQDAGQGNTQGTGGATSDLPPTPGMGLDSQANTPGGGPGMRSRASSYIPSMDTDLEGTRRIWGTNYTQSEMQGMIRRFLVTFHAAASDGQPVGPENKEEAAGMATYVSLLRQMMTDGHTFLNIDAQHLKQSSPRLLQATVESPEDMLLLWDMGINKLAAEQRDLLEELGLEQPADKIQGRLFNLDNVRPIRDLDPLDIDALVSVKGMITRTGNIIPDLRLAVFRCEACAHEVHDLVTHGIVNVPTACNNCRAKQTMRIIPNRCAYLNRQIVKMQEDPTNIPEGETPRSLLMYVFDTNVDACKPGDKVTITGVFRATRMRLNPRQRAAHALFKTYLDVVHVAKDEVDKLFRPRGAGGNAAEVSRTLQHVCMQCLGNLSDVQAWLEPNT
eukprot:GHRR01021500.1.p1 GENE.GHRR01021500.1~~GHRR01021500.1.p1  ORF type:complete len:510 (+),score=166.40 GHRR01021500.1:266-1795(+)